MSIQALPESTTRRLSAGQALPSPAALVKELLDNAIDAGATSIEVLLSVNTLDKIEVRDNGFGIAADDLERVGKRGHTSKLVCFEELRAVSRVSLGFRGEALASACIMGEVAITTRTKGDSIAASVKLKPTGGVCSRSSKSHPIGTTVCVSNLFSKFPVRKQNFLKQTPKTISEIKGLLQSYALARLHIRLSLKVTKSPKANWTYVSRAQDGLREAAAKVVGKEVAALCQEETRNFHVHNTTINALLPRQGVDLSKVKGGCHVSVDGRPLSSSGRSLARKFYRGYKEALNDLARKTGQELCKDPFFYLKLNCVGDIYDPNVEPSKDDIVFASGDFLVTSLKEFFRSLYWPPAVVPQNQFPQLTAILQRQGFDSESDHGVLLSQALFNEAQEPVQSAPSASDDGQSVEDQQSPHGHLLHARPQTPVITPVPPQAANSLDNVLSPWSIRNRSAPVPQTSVQPPFQLTTSDTTTSDTTTSQQSPHNRQPPNALQTPPASHENSIDQILPRTPYNPFLLHSLPSKPPPGQKTIESWLTQSNDDSHPEGSPRPHTSMTILNDETLFRHSHSRPRRQSSYGDEAETICVQTPPQTRQKLGPASVKAESPPMDMNATSRLGSRTSGCTAVDAFARHSPGVPHSQLGSSNDPTILSIDNEPHILGYSIHPSQRQLTFNAEADGFHSGSQSRGGDGGGYNGKSRGSFTNNPFKLHRRKSVAELNAGSHHHYPGLGLPKLPLDDDEQAQEPTVPIDEDLIGHGTMEQALDFEYRKIQATKRLRAENSLLELDPNSVLNGSNIERTTRMLGQTTHIACEHHVSSGNLVVDVNRLGTAFTGSTSKPGLDFAGDKAEIAMPADDPRAYLMKRHGSMSRAGKKIKKCKTALLPLETVQPQEELHHLVFTIAISDVNVFARQREKLEGWDEYVRYGEYKGGLDMYEDEIEEVEENIRYVMELFEARN